MIRVTNSAGKLTKIRVEFLSWNSLRTTGGVPRTGSSTNGGINRLCNSLFCTQTRREARSACYHKREPVSECFSSIKRDALMWAWFQLGSALQTSISLTCCSSVAVRSPPAPPTSNVSLLINSDDISRFCAFPLGKITWTLELGATFLLPAPSGFS